MPSNNSTPVGQSKITYNGGFLSGSLDKNSKTRGTNVVGTISSVGLWRRMEQTCYAVQLGLRGLTGVLQGVSWDVCHHEDVPQRIVDATRSMLFERMESKFSVVAENMFRAVAMGAAPQEITLLQEDGMLWIRDLSPRPIQTIDIHTIRKNSDGWMECTQRFFEQAGRGMRTVQYGSPGVDGQGFLLWVTYGDNGGPLGEGFYRSIFPIFETWEVAVRYYRLAIQRAGLGVPVAFQRQNMTLTDADLSATAEDIGKVTTHEVGSLILPPALEKLEWAYANPEAIRALIDAVNDCETRILMSFGAQYAARGTLTGTGTNAAGQTDVSELASHRQAFVSWLAGQMQPLIDWWIVQNFGPQRHYPELSGSVPEEMDPQQFVAALAQAKSSGVLIVDSHVRDEVRKALKLEPEGDEVEEELEEPEEPDVEESRDVVEEEPAKVQEEEKEEDAEEGGAEAETEEEMCSCQHHSQFAADPVVDATEKAGGPKVGVRKPPQAGGQDKRTGPNGRDLSRLERLVNWRKIEFTLDSSTQSMQGVLMDVREELAKYYVSQIGGKAWETSTEAAKALQGVKVPASLRSRAKKAILSELRRIADVAEQSVDAEFERQGAQGNERFVSDSLLGSMELIDIQATEATDNAIKDAQSQLVKAALAIVAPSKEEIMALLEGATDELSAGAASAEATLVTTDTFSRARVSRANQIKESTGNKPKNVWYSAVLDANTCRECAAADSLHGEIGGTPLDWDGSEIAEFMPPYQRCLGGVRCRCQLIFEW